MPTYSFKCPVCDVGFDAVRPMQATGSLPACPTCGTTDVRRVFSFGTGGQGPSYHPLSPPPPRNVKT